MMQQYFLIAFLGVSFLFSGCNPSGKSNSTTLSGEIINPQSSSIRIIKNNKILDTVPINDNNQFYYRFSDTLSSGLYTFQHDYDTYYETQTFYIEQGDSLQFRLNTREFDESLMYSGSNSDANNFLMKLFLDNQNNSRIVPNYYRIEPDEYILKVDSIKENQKKQLKKLREGNKISKDFKRFASSVIDYATFDLHERYYFLVNKYNKKFKEKLPTDFLAYREKADFNDEKLQSHYIYQYFLDDFLKNVSVEECLEIEPRWSCFNLRSKESLEHRMQISDSIFTLKTLRSSFLTDFGARLIVAAQSKQEIDTVVRFLENAEHYGAEDMESIYGLAEVHHRQFIGNIGNLKLMGTAGEDIQIGKILSKPTVFYYWSTVYRNHRKNQYEKISDLREQLPEIDFIGVNIDDHDNNELWGGGLIGEEYYEFEFRLICPSNQRSFYRNYLNKLVLVDPAGEILNNSFNLYDRKLKEKLIAMLE